MKQLGK